MGDSDASYAIQNLPSDPLHQTPPPSSPSPPILRPNPTSSFEDPKVITPGSSLYSLPLPAVRVTSEFDSESSIFLHKVSCRFFDHLAKLKLSFQNNRNWDFSGPQLGFITKYFSVLYDAEARKTLLKGSFDAANGVQFRAIQDVQEKQGEVAILASFSDPYKIELCSNVPSTGLPRATFRFPLGEVTLEEKYDELKRVLSINGILKGQLMSGTCTASYNDNDLNLRYSYKDKDVTFIPSISLPSNAVSFAFKRHFSPSDKLSYWYHFYSNHWSTVYKHKVSKDFKIKAGYDSEVRLGWASLWVGDEEGKAKLAPMKMKVQFMLQVPQDNIESSVFMFRVKKRWDLF